MEAAACLVPGSYSNGASANFAGAPSGCRASGCTRRGRGSAVRIVSAAAAMTLTEAVVENMDVRLAILGAAAEPLGELGDRAEFNQLRCHVRLPGFAFRHFYSFRVRPIGTVPGR